MAYGHHRLLTWRFVQLFFWLAGGAILYCLFFVPRLGLLLFWNVLIPLAPALFVFAPGLWRNICPLATTVLLPRHLGLSAERRLSPAQTGTLNVIGIAALYALVPLRHAVFNNSGQATGWLIILLASIGLVAGFRYEWKSAWCSGLCPVHPVEKLYGSNVTFSLPNAHCDKCRKCVTPCPDSTHNIYPEAYGKTWIDRLGGALITGGLPGFIWGWFHVPDQATLTTFANAMEVYKFPLAGLLVTFSVYAFVSSGLHGRSARKVSRFFAALAVSCYYWYRIPALFGFGSTSKDGLLVDLTGTLSSGGVLVITIILVLLFFYWLVIRKESRKAWIIRPEFAERATI
jgi:hypothetical protein